MAFHLAQVNIARLKAPLDSPELADFVAALDRVNTSADESPGFIWRLQTDEGNATSIRAFDWDADGSIGVIVNMSVWESVETLAEWVYNGMHREVLRERASWFQRAREPMVALWWVSAGTIPTTEDAEARIRYLRAHGPTTVAFTFRQRYMPPAHQLQPPTPGRDEWLCRT